jgi:hypothetical protein
MKSFDLARFQNNPRLLTKAGLSGLGFDQELPADYNTNVNPLGKSDRVPHFEELMTNEKLADQAFLGRGGTGPVVCHDDIGNIIICGYYNHYESGKNSVTKDLYDQGVLFNGNPQASNYTYTTKRETLSLAQEPRQEQDLLPAQ